MSTTVAPTASSPDDWPAGLVVRGSFSVEEVDILRQGVWPLFYADEEAAPVHLQIDPACAAGWAALPMLDRVLRQPAGDALLNPAVRLVMGFGDVRNFDSASDLNAAVISLEAGHGMAPPTYVVRVALNGMPYIGQQVVKVADTIAETRQRLQAGDAKFVLRASLVAALFMFLHELGHVFNGHHDWTPDLMQNVDALGKQWHATRRALEFDADLFAASMVGRLVADPDPSESLSESTLLATMAGAFAVFATLSEGGAWLDTPCYHSPMVRLNAVAGQLARVQGLKPELGAKLFAAFLAEMTLARERGDLLLERIVNSSHFFNQDDASFRATTVPLVRELLVAGKLRKWLGPAQAGST